MRRSRTLRMVSIGVLTAAAATFGFSSTATAQTEDVPVIVDNLPTALEELTTGLQEAGFDFADHTSVVQLQQDVLAAVVASGTALVDGTEQFGALGLGFTLVSLGVNQALEPYLGAIDDPSTAGDLIDPDDLSTLLGNLGPTVENVKENVVIAAVEGLGGNLREDGALGLPGTPATYGNALAAVTSGFQALVDDTTLEPLGNGVLITVLIGGAAVDGFVGGYVQDLEDALTPALADADAVTAPVISLLEAL